jgi:hypothetical protein
MGKTQREVVSLPIAGGRAIGRVVKAWELCEAEEKVTGWW